MVHPIVELLADIQEAALISAIDNSVAEQIRLNGELAREVRGDRPPPPVMGPALFVLTQRPRRQSQTKIDKLYGI